jgi:hypothetical protein
MKRLTSFFIAALKKHATKQGLSLSKMDCIAPMDVSSRMRQKQIFPYLTVRLKTQMNIPLLTPLRYMPIFCIGCLKLLASRRKNSGSGLHLDCVSKKGTGFW